MSLHAEIGLVVGMQDALTEPGTAADPRPRGVVRSGVFISYSRIDGAELAASLRERLVDAGLTVWHDLTELAAGDRWWQEIREALGRVSSVVLVLTEGALRSPVVQRELRLARQQGVAVRPITPTASTFETPMPRWLAATHRYGAESGVPALLMDLRRSPKVRRVPFMAEPLPEDFVQRTEEFERVVNLLADIGAKRTVAITAALRGAGGYGKTTLARAVCDDPRVQEVFDDGVLWITLGENPSRADLIERIVDLVETLDEERPGFAGLDAASARLRESLGDRALLFVIDDVWNSEHLAPFLRGGTRCVRLVTTRNSETLPPAAYAVSVDQMQTGEACELLGHGLASADTGALRLLAARLGEWPLLLKLANGVLRRRLVDAGQGFAQAVDWINRALDRKGVVAFDARDADERNRAVARTIRLSLEGLAENEVQRFFDLAVFPEDLDIPIQVVERYWHRQGGLDPFDVEDLCVRLYSMSLLQQIDLTARTLRLHDAIRHFLNDVGGADALVERHDALVGALCLEQRPCDGALSNPYLLRHLGHHLAGADRLSEIADAVRSVRYASARVRHHKSWSLLEDMLLARRAVPNDLALAGLARDTARSGHVLDRVVDAHELEQTMYCRMSPFLPPAHQHPAHPGDDAVLRARRAMPLMHPDLERAISVAEDSLRCCTFGPKGDWLASGSHGGGGWVFDGSTGKPLVAFRGQVAPINGICSAPSGKWLASVCDDGRLALWDPASGGELDQMERAGVRLLCCDVSPDSSLLVAGGADNRLRLWRVDSGRVFRTMTGHAASVVDCRFSLDGSMIVTASADGSWALWESQTGHRVRRVFTQGLPLTCCAFAGGGSRVVTGSFDASLSVWDSQTGELLAVLPGHEGAVRACVVSPVGQWLLSAGDDGAVRLWNLANGTLHKTLHGDGLPIRALAIDAAGKRFASVGRAGTVNLWQLELDVDEIRSPGAAPPLEIVAVDPAGARFLTSNALHAICLWDAATSEPIELSDPLMPALPGAPSRARLSRHASHAAVSTANASVLLWDLRIGGAARALGPGGSAPWFEFAPDGGRLFWLDGDSRLHIEDLFGLRPPRELPGVWSHLDDAAFADTDLWLGALSSGFVDWIDMGSGLSRAPNNFGADEHGTQTLSLSGHGKAVTRCHFAKAGNILLTASEDGSCAAWDSRTGLRVSALPAGPHWATAVVASPDASCAYAAWWDGSIAAWRLEHASPGSTFGAMTLPVLDLAISHDGARLLSASWDGTLRTWDAITGRAERIMRHTGALNCCALGVNFALAGGVDGSLTSWTLNDGTVMAEYAGHTAQINRCVMDSTCTIMISGSDDGTARVWEVASGRLLRNLDHDHHPVVDVGTDDRGELVLTAAWDDSLSLWDVASGERLQSLDLRDWAGTVQSCALSADGRLAAVGKGRTIRVLDVTDRWRVLQTLPKQFEVNVSNSPFGACLSVDGRPMWLASIDSRRALTPDRRHAIDWEQSVDCRTVTQTRGTQIRSLPELPVGATMALACALRPGGQQAAYVFADGVVRVSDIARSVWVAAIHTGDQLSGCIWLDDGRQLVAYGSMGLQWLSCEQ